MEQMSSNLSLLVWDPRWGLLVVPSFDFFTLKADIGWWLYSKLQCERGHTYTSVTTLSSPAATTDQALTSSKGVPVISKPGVLKSYKACR